MHLPLPTPYAVEPSFAAEADGASHGLTLESIYAAHARHVAELAFRLMGNDRDLDDVVQETFLDVRDGLDSRDPTVPVRAWVRLLAVRRVRRLFAKRRRFRVFGFRWLEAMIRAEAPRERERDLDLYAALETLPDELRIPFCLHRVDELTLPETAAACEVSLATVKRRIAEAEARLEKRLVR